MAEPSSFRGAIDFFGKIGLYDVVLPFLLVFTIVFAILEKSKILGVDKTKDGEEYPKRNLNSMVAFCIAFFVVASTEIVRVINEGLANVALLMIIAVCFLMLVGTFVGDKYTDVLKKWNVWFIVASLVGIVLVFLNAVHYEDQTWLEIAWNYVVDNWSSEFVGSIILFIIIFGFMIYITGKPKDKSSKAEEKS